MSTTVTLDGTDITLEYVGILATRWNGFLVPLVTEAQMSTFIATWRASDPNGTWGKVYSDHYGLTVTRNDSDDPDEWDCWPVHSRTDDGTKVYAVDGWVWVAE